MRDAFGRLLVSPERLSRVDRINELRRVSGRMLADPDPVVRWLGDNLGEWLRDGGRLETKLGVSAPRGSHATPQAHARRAEVDSLLRRLSLLAGGDAEASQMLQGRAPARGAAAGLMQRLRELRAPSSRRAFVRARTRQRP